jgi:VWFA-related protein
MRGLAILPLLLVSVALSQTTAPAPAPQDDAFTLRANSNLVLVPAQVLTRKGEMIYALKPEQFVLEDNGVRKKIKIDEDVDARGLALVVVVQCSRAAFMQFNNMRGLAAMVDDITGASPREVAVVSYGRDPTLVANFSFDPATITANLSKIEPCDDSEAAPLDAVGYANDMLNKLQPRLKVPFRQAILLIGETRDHGSRARPEDVIAELGRSNTVVDSVSYNPGKTEVLNSLLHGQMGPGPLGLLVMAVEALKKNVPHTLATLSGGEYVNFSTQKGFEGALHDLANHVHNYYLLSFQAATNGEPGLHQISVKVPDYPEARIHARLTYYAGDAAPENSDKK